MVAAIPDQAPPAVLAVICIVALIALAINDYFGED